MVSVMTLLPMIRRDDVIARDVRLYAFNNLRTAERIWYGRYAIGGNLTSFFIIPMIGNSNLTGAGT
jgi:hypothetical protein